MQRTQAAVAAKRQVSLLADELETLRRLTASDAQAKVSYFTENQKLRIEIEQLKAVKNVTSVTHDLTELGQDISKAWRDTVDTVAALMLLKSKVEIGSPPELHPTLYVGHPDGSYTQLAYDLWADVDRLTKLVDKLRERMRRQSQKIHVAREALDGEIPLLD